MLRNKFLITVLPVLGLLLALGQPAHAAFLFCNKTQTVIEAAFGYREQLDWVSEGWWQLQPGLCARVYGKPLNQRFYFYYARALAQPRPGERPPMNWSGKYALCADNKAFKVVGDQDCETRGYRTLYFQQADVGQNQRDYTLNFEDGSR
jgi:uncharacterized membrane protein